MRSQNEVPSASQIESASIAAMSRAQVVDAYEDWTDVSRSEALCIEWVLDTEAVVLDLGCGAGRLADWMGDRYRSYLGIDASRAMIEAAQRKHLDLPFIVADILDFEAADSSFTVIALLGNVIDSLHPIERRSTLLKRCFKWLQPGGAIVGSSHLSHADQVRGYYTEDYHGSQLHQFRSSASEMAEELESIGFELGVFTRDYRKRPADWANWLALRPPSST